MTEEKKAVYVILLWQIVLIAMYGLFAQYDREADAKAIKTNTAISKYYAMFQDVHVMIFIGFGFLMTFLKKYGHSSVGFNFLLAATVIEWGILCNGFIDKIPVKVGIKSLIDADVLSAAVLISMGAVLGKTSPVQLVIMGIIESIIFAANFYIGLELKVSDVGGSMFVHVFGAYFGLAVSKVLGKPKNTEHEGSTYNSDLFAMIGTLFLWVFWPSFNGALSVTPDGQQRAVINTYLSIASSCVVSFAVSALTDKDHRFNMVHIQNATLAGGVAVGTAADFMLQPYAAMLIGSSAGLLSTAGYAYLQPFLDRKFNLHDTCGVNNLHGMPGILAGLIGALTAFLANPNDYGSSLYLMFPARAPGAFTNELRQIQHSMVEVLPGDNRPAGVQALHQLGALAITFIIAIGSGAVTGYILKFTSSWAGVPDEQNFDDSPHWLVEDNEGSVDKIEVSTIKIEPEPQRTTNGSESVLQIV